MKILSFSPRLFVFAASLFLPATLLAQGTIWTVAGPTIYDELGRSVDAIGDLNGDGYDEVIGGAPYAAANGQDCGLITVYDGASSSILFNIDGDDARDEMGLRVAGVGDVNGDNVPDFAGAAPSDELGGNGSGTVRVYSGSTGALLHQFIGSAADEHLGGDLSYLGDVNGDGRADILIGATQKGGGASTQYGFASVYSGASGALLYTVSGSAANDQFGYAVGGGGDLDGDGVNDFAVGVYGDDTNGLNTGAVHVFSGATGLLIWSAFGDNDRDHLGNKVAILGDLNGDGACEVGAGAIEDDNLATDGGAVRIFDGATGAILTTLDGQNALDEMGSSIARYSDITGDGIEEFLVGVHGWDGVVGKDSGLIMVIDGSNFTTVQFVEGTLADDRLGFSCAGAGDINGDNIDDYIGGARQRGGAGVGNGTGYVRAFDSTGTPPPPPVRWPNLPSTFMAVGANGYVEDFEALAGSIPSHMAVNELDAISRTADPEAWCNLGQNGPCISSNSGIFALELGGNPVMSVHHDVANGLVVGIDGTGSTSLVLDYWAINYGEENHLDDGIWVSNDGTNWEAVQSKWGHIPSSATWTQVLDLDLTTTTVSTTGQFYLLFAQADNYEYGTADGIGIDDFTVREAGSGGPTLVVSPFPPVGGQAVTLGVDNNNPGDMVIICYSMVGGGPTSTPWGTALLTPPVAYLPFLFADPAGSVSFPATAPPALTGRPMWMQALNHTQGIFSNGLNWVFG
ncbi:MAG: hypothetical protein QGH51_06935 [Planctomycetota bacterium]|nr:hypothetical protein [Planctomycetota bacterium]